ncbi:MAG: 7-carboxy-7-deazaguanine synthase QueE [Thermacetogeniaceae bacterium]
MEGWVAEVFSGIQGEGPWVGCRHLFVRLYGCNLCCDYCDTPAARQRRKMGRIEEDAGGRNFVPLENPISASCLFEKLERMRLERHQAVSITGGEPLTQADFLKELLLLLRKAGAAVYLETNGTLPAAYEGVMGLVDITAMDFKLASATGKPAPWREHERFLRLARESSDVFVKVVVSAETTPEELGKVSSLVAEVDPGITVVLQPLTPVGDAPHLKAPEPEQLLVMQELVSERVKDVRVIPQVHKLIGQI